MHQNIIKIKHLLQILDVLESKKEKKNTAIEAEDKDNVKDEAFKQVQKPIDGMIIMHQIPVQCKI